MDGRTSWLSLDCYKCGKHLGFMPYCGPTGFFYCDPCKEADEREEEEAAAAREAASDG